MSFSKSYKSVFFTAFFSLIFSFSFFATVSASQINGNVNDFGDFGGGVDGSILFEGGYQPYSASLAFGIDVVASRNPINGYSTWGICFSGASGANRCFSHNYITPFGSASFSGSDSIDLISTTYANYDSASFYINFASPYVSGGGGCDPSVPDGAGNCGNAMGDHVANYNFSASARKASIDNFSQSANSTNVGGSVTFDWTTNWGHTVPGYPKINLTGPGGGLTCTNPSLLGTSGDTRSGTITCTGNSAGNYTVELEARGPAENGGERVVKVSRQLAVGSPPGGGGGSVLSFDLKYNNSNGPVTINSGDSGTLGWTISGADFCSGNWSSSGAEFEINHANGSYTYSTGAITSSKQYRLYCENRTTNEHWTDTVEINVNGQPPVTPPPPSGSCVDGATVTITGPSTLTVGQTGNYAVTANNTGTGDASWYHGGVYSLRQTSSPSLTVATVPNACTTSDPFTAFGGGTCFNGAWYPPGMSHPGFSSLNYGHLAYKTDPGDNQKWTFAYTPSTSGSKTLSFQMRHLGGQPYYNDCAPTPSSDLYFGNNASKSITVNAATPVTPVDGTCGTANKTYAASASSFGSDTFCSVGTASPASPTFPASGASTNWVCFSTSGGANSGQCTATHTGIGYTVTVTTPNSPGGSVTSGDGSINCGSTCSATYASGSGVTLQAIPVSSYWQFSGWTGDCTGTSLCTLNLTAPKSAGAIFTPRLFNYEEF